MERIEVFEWQSYSCNNSSDYRLIAELGTPAKASAMASELQAFFKKHARQYDAKIDDPDFEWPGEPTDAAVALGKKYGHTWKKFLIWGDDLMEGDEPNVATVGSSLVLYHTYCGGFGEDLRALLQKAGATLPEKSERTGAPILRADFTVPTGPKGDTLVDELTTLFQAIEDASDVSECEPPRGLSIELTGSDDEYAFCCEDRRVALTWPVAPKHIKSLTSFLTKRGAQQLELRAASPVDIKDIARRGKAIAKERARAEAKAEKERAKAAPKPVTFDPTGLSFLFTGTLESMTREAAQARVAAIGGIVASSVTPKLGVLVVGGEGGTSEKQRKAEALIANGAPIRIITETSFLHLKGTSSDAVPVHPPSLTVCTKPIDNYFPALCGGTLDAPILVMVGGLGGNHLLSSSDGRKFKELKVKGPGLRAVLIHDKHVWLCGEYGSLVHSSSGFSRFKKIDLRVSACMFGLARAPDGAIWLSGDDGYLARSTNGTSFKRISGVKGTVGKLVATPDGVLVPAKSGLYRTLGASVKKLGLSKPVGMAIVTRDGTIVAVGENNTAYRSIDNGKTFRSVKVPSWSPTKVPRSKAMARAYWAPKAKDLNVISQLADGRIIVGGDCGVILVSSDDGQTFTRVGHAITPNSFWGIGTFEGKVFLGGENNLVIRCE